MRPIIRFTVLAILLGSLAACSSPEEKAAGYIESGNQLFAENDLDKAAIEYRNALQINQNLPNAWYGLARIHERRQEWKQAYGSLVRIRDSHPNHVDARIMLAQIYLASNQLEEALEDAGQVLELAPDDARAHSLMAAVQYRLANFEAAQQSVEAALALDPASADAILVKARILAAEKEYDEALDLLDVAIQAAPDNVSLYLMKIQTYTELEDNAAVEEVLRAMIEQFPENVAFKQALMQHFVRTDQGDQAEQVLVQIAEDSPDDIEAKLRLVSFKNRYRSVDEAIALIETYIQQDSSEYRYRFALAELLLSSDRTDEAIEVYEGIIADDGLQPNGLEARNELALMHLRAGKRDEAGKLVAEVLEADANNEDALLLRAGFGIDAREYDDAIVDLRTVLRDNPNSIKALGLIGQAYVATGSAELALETYGRAFSISTQTPAIANPYANLLMRNNNPQQADEVLQASIKAGNRSVEAVRLLTEVKLRLGEWDQAEQLAQQLKAVEGGEALSQQLLGLVYQGKQQQDDSIEAFKRAHELAPQASQPLVGLVRAYVRNDQVDEAVAFLQAEIAANKDNTAAYMLLGQLNLRTNDKPTAIDHFRRAIEINPGLEPGYRALASVYFNDNRPAEAEKVLRDGLLELPGNSSITISLASVYESQEEFDKAIGLYEGLLQENPDLIVAKNNLASLLTDFRDDQASHDRARQMAAEFRDSSVPQFRDTYAWAAVKSGINLEEAIVILEGIVEENEGVGVYHYHLGEGYRKKGDVDNARLSLARALELEPEGSSIAADAEKSLELISE